MKKKPLLKLYNYKNILSVVLIFSILVNILIIGLGNFQEPNYCKNNNQTQVTPDAQPIKSASQTAYLHLLNFYNTDGSAYGLDVRDLYVGSEVWIADGTHGIVKLSVEKDTGAIYYEDSFDTAGTSYDVVYANHWGNPMLIVADGEDGTKILHPDFEDVFDDPPMVYHTLSYGGGIIENNTQSVAVYNASLYDAGFDPLTFIYTQDSGSVSEVEAIQLPWMALMMLAGDFRQTDSFSTSWPIVVSRVYVSGKYLYTAGLSGVNIYDLSNPSTLSYVSHCPGTYYSSDVIVQGNYLYVVDSNDLVIIDLTTPSTPVNVSSFDEFDGQIFRISVAGNYAYLTDSQGIYIVDISNPTSPEKIGHYTALGLTDIHAEDGYVYVAAGANGFYFLELEVVEDSISISSPTAVQTGKTYPLSYTHQGDIPNISLSLYSSGMFYRNIRPNTPNNGSFNWHIPGDIPHGTSYSIRIEDATNPSVIATTSEFEIYTNSFSFPSSYVNVTWETGNSYIISWDWTGHIDSVDLQLLKEGGVIHDIIIETDNDGTFDCPVPMSLESSTEYQLKISDHDDPSISLTSETFTIKKVSRFWNELWFWGIILAGLILLCVVVPAAVKRRRFTKARKKFTKINENFVLIRDVNLFISYSHKDKSRFKVPTVADQLSKKPHISQIVYSQKDAQKDWVNYMNKNLGQSDGLVLFCSQNSLKSRNVEAEWSAAMAADKPVIPVFKDNKHIPPILKGKLGVVFMGKKLDYNGDAIYALVKNHLGEPKKRN